MSGSLYHSAKRSLRYCLHLEPGRRSLLLGKSYALAMSMFVPMCLLGMYMCLMRMSLMRVIMLLMTMIFMRMVVSMLMLLMGMMLFSMCMMLMSMFVIVITLLATTRSEYQCRTYANQRLYPSIHFYRVFCYSRYNNSIYECKDTTSFVQLSCKDAKHDIKNTIYAG